MDRITIKRSLKENTAPPWKCPTCKLGTLTIKKGDLLSEEFKTSKNAHDCDGFNGDWIVLGFTAMLRCANARCGEVVVCCGKGGLDQEYTGHDEDGYPISDWVENFQPEYFIPHLNIFPLPKGTPEEVRDEVNKSFALFFCDSKAAANHVRSAIEQLLNALKIKRYTIRNNKRRVLQLHFRLENLPAKYADIKDALIAIKWLGNAGSHPGETLSKNDVLDAYEILEHLLEDMYNPKKVKLGKLVKEINKRKGPVKKGNGPLF